MKKSIIYIALAALAAAACTRTVETETPVEGRLKTISISASGEQISKARLDFPRINWEENASGYIEWTDAKLAVTFPDTAESRQIEFRPGWLPEELSELMVKKPLSRLTAEELAYKFPELSGSQPLLIESYSMSMFNNGGALLLLYYTPEEIIEERWEEQGVDVMRFHATMHVDAAPHIHAPERTIEQDIILMSNPEAGWIVCLNGEIGMDDLVKVARNLEIFETGTALSYDDFENHYAFMDGGVG